MFCAFLPVGKVEHLRLAAITYGRENEGKNYFTDLLKVINVISFKLRKLVELAVVNCLATKRTYA